MGKGDTAKLIVEAREARHGFTPTTGPQRPRRWRKWALPESDDDLVRMATQVVAIGGRI